MKNYRTAQALSLSHIHNHNTVFIVIATQLQKSKEKTVIYITWYRERNESEVIVAMSRKHVPNMYTHIHGGWEIARCDRASPVCHKVGVRVWGCTFDSGSGF